MKSPTGLESLGENDGAPEHAVRRPALCWQGMLSLGLSAAWCVFITTSASPAFLFNWCGYVTHFLVIGSSVAFGIAELWKLRRDRGTILGLLLAINGIIVAAVITYLYLAAWRRMGSSEF